MWRSRMHFSFILVKKKKSQQAIVKKTLVLGVFLLQYYILSIVYEAE